jgi:hypothetical protein
MIIHEFEHKLIEFTAQVCHTRIRSWNPGLDELLKLIAQLAQALR